MKRTPKEIKNIQNACKITDQAFDFILKEIKLGISEKKLAFKLRKFIKINSDGISFKPIVAYGENTSEIHHKPTDRKLKKGDIIMFDFGAKVNGYCSDMTRTVFFGKASPKQKEVYKVVLKAQEKTIKYLESRIKNYELCKASEVDKIARQYIISKKYPSIPHGLGHALGRKVHQAPRLSPKSRFYLKPGMVVTIEPAIYLKKFGIRIEDDVLIKESGIETLTSSSKKLIIIDNN